MLFFKPITWTEPSPPDGKNHFYDHCIGTHPIGEMTILWKSWKERDTYTVLFNGIESVGDGYTLDEAKSIAQEFLDAKVAACLIHTHVTST